MSSILYYSNFCEKSKKILQTLIKKKIREKWIWGISDCPQRKCINCKGLRKLQARWEQIHAAERGNKYIYWKNYCCFKQDGGFELCISLFFSFCHDNNFIFYFISLLWKTIFRYERQIFNNKKYRIIHYR